MHDEAAYLVGQALGFMRVGQLGPTAPGFFSQVADRLRGGPQGSTRAPGFFSQVNDRVQRAARGVPMRRPPTQQPIDQPPPPPLDPQEAIARAGRLVGRAYQLYMQAGLTQDQAASRISNFALMLGSLE